MNFDPLSIASTVSGILTGPGDPTRNISAAVEALTAGTSACRAFVLRYVRQSETFSIVATAGFNAKEFRRFESKAEASMLRKVFDDAKPSILAELSKEASLSFIELDRESSLITVPMMLAGQNLGLLSLQFSYDASRNFEQTSSFLSLIGSMIGQTLRIEHSVHGERQKLIDENSNLKQELKERHEFTHIIGNSGPMKLVYDNVTQVARSNATVLLRGESGT
jgi:Nif-specific regulatory protein